jgi:uncharacterized protein (TIGR02271 family)
VKDAPKADGDLDAADEEALFAHYNVNTLDPDYGVGERADTGYSHQGRREDDAMTRSEEELRVSTERRETGKARLRKYVVAEQRQITVPVTREEVRVEREPISDANVDEAVSGPDIAEGEHEVITHEEVPVVTTETVPKERVRLQKATVTDQETVSRAVRKEKIDVEGDRSSDTGGDHSAAKGHKAPSDRQGASRSAAAPRGGSETAGDLDANATKAQLMDIARQLDVSGRSKMKKDELVEAIARASRNKSA